MATIRRILMLDNVENRTEAWQSTAEEIKNRAISSIFFPKEGDQKSILLKRGPIQLCDNAKGDLMLFSRGCVVSSIDFVKIAKNDLYLIHEGNDDGLIRDWGTNKWRQRFDLLDFDRCGSFDKDKLRKFYQSKSLPITEEELNHIFEKLDTDSNGLVSADDFRESAQQATMLFSTKDPTPTTQKQISFLSGLGHTFESIRKSLTSELEDVLKPRSEKNNKKSDHNSSGTKWKVVENAILFSDIDRIETLDNWDSREIKKYIYGQTMKTKYNDAAIRQCSFAIFIRGNTDCPLVVLCARLEEANAWMDAFRLCIGRQKSMVLGRKRSSVSKKGIIFGINSSRRWWGDAKELAPSVNWDGSD